MNTNLFMGFSLLTISLFAQEKDSLLNTNIPVLKEIVLSDDKLSLWAVGSSVLDLGTSLRDNRLTDIASLLSNKSHVRIRSYGVGGLSSASFRGAGASHTQISWNGVILNLATTGQQDLTLIPALFVDELKVQSGGLSSLLGEGALGGSIHLRNKYRFNQAYNTQLNFSVGSFGKQMYGLSSQVSDAKNAFDIRFYLHHAENDYSFNDPYLNGEKRDLEHASFSSKGFQTSYVKRFNRYWSADIRYWHQGTFRELAPSISEAQSTAEQEDESNILLFHVNHQKEKFEWNANVSYHHSDLSYEDSLKNVFSNHTTHRYKISQDFRWDLKGKEILRLESSMQLDSVTSTNINDLRGSETRFTLGLNHNKHLSDNVLIVSGARQEIVDNELSPFLPSISFQLKLNPNILLACGSYRSYKRPSYNDRFWDPGGNPNLLEEVGWMSNLRLVYEKSNTHVKKRMGMSMYYGKIKNWIIWLPSAVESYWVPENKSLVEQIGFELEGLYEFHNSWCVFTYETTSSYQMVKDLNTEMIGSRQLMYIPVFQTNQRISMEVEKITWHYQHHFESVRYTSVDHKSYLDPYSLANVGIKYSYEMQGEPINIGFQVNNLWDANYQMVQNRPMPGRHFNFNINFYL